MGKFLNESGEEIEAFTPEEVEAKINEAKSGYIPATEVETIKTQLNSLQIEKQELEDKLKEAVKSDDKNGESVINKMKEELDNKISAIQESIINNEKQSIISKIAGGDKELEKKIELEFENINGKDITERVIKAYKIVSDKPVPGILDGVINFGGKGSNPTRLGKDEESDNSKAIRSILGISDEDVKKYGVKK